MKPFALLFFFVSMTVVITSCKDDDSDSDPCINVVCLNGGECRDGSCRCPNGFKGESCEIEVMAEPCTDTTCLNGGTCINGVCMCPEGYTGFDCGTQKNPTKIRITNIRLAKFPERENGVRWDLTNEPDLYIRISFNGSQVYQYPTFIQNADVGVVHTFKPQSPIEITSPTQPYTLELFDYDLDDADDLMASFTFKPYDPQLRDGFPADIILMDDETTFGISVIYNFD